MSTADTEETPYEMQEEGGVPTMDAVAAGSNLSQPSIDKLTRSIQSSDDISEMPVSESPTDGISAKGVSDTNSSISNELAPGGLSIFTATCTLFNISGASLYVPWAFAQGGTLLTSFVLGAVLLQAYISATFLLEASARAQALDLLRTDGSLPQRYTPLKIRERKYELSLLTKIFIGKAGTIFFSLTTLTSMYGVMWGFCTIFANAFADKFPLGDMQDDGYKLYIALFMVVIVPMSCTSITDQQWIQMAFVTARIVMVIMMVVTVVIAYGTDEPHFGSQVGPVNDIPLAKPSNIVQVTMTCVFLSSMQAVLPTMADETRSKTGLTQVFAAAATSCYVSNLFLGILFALFFGQDQPDSSNLNWVNYHGGTGEAEPAAWTAAISGYIVLSAAISVAPIYAVVAITTGGTLMALVYGDHVHEAEQDRRIRTVFRLLASIPPAFGALFLSDFSVITKYTGIFMILSYTVCPALLTLSSRECMKKKNLPLTTYYSSYYSSRVWSYGLLLLSAAVIGGVGREWVI
jgi:undecaprenyl pyrophosphate phosphatase UppP